MHWKQATLLVLLLVTLSARAQTPVPILTSPTSNSTNGNPEVSVSYFLPAAPLTNSVQLVFTNSQESLTLLLTSDTNVSFMFSSHLPQVSPNVISTIPANGTLSNGIYNVTLSYQDTNADPAALVQVTNVTIAAMTQPPLLFSPANNSSFDYSGVRIDYQLPQTPAPGTVVMDFTNVTTNVVLFLNNFSSVNFIANPHSLTSSSPQIVSAMPTNLPDGSYSVSLTFQDTYGDPAASVQVTNVLVDTVTQPPLLISPTNNVSFNSSGMRIDYQLPEAATPGTVLMNFFNAITNVSLVLNNSVSNNFTANTHSLLSSPQIFSATPTNLPDGTYSAALSYQDAYGNPAATVVVSNILVDTVTLPPVLLSPVNNSAVTPAGVTINYRLPEQPAAGSVFLFFHNAATNVFLGLNNSTSNNFVLNPVSLLASAPVMSANPNNLPDGRYAVTLSYQDALFNPAATATATNVLAVVQPLNIYPVSGAYDSGGFQFSFSNNVPTGLGFAYDVLSSTNLAAPLDTWVDLGPATESPPGLFQFLDNRTNSPVEFYRVQVQ